MADPKRDASQRELQILRRRHQESNTILGIIMAGIAALFIVAIVVAYNYASSTSTAENPQPPASASGPASTTGAGSAERGAPAQPSKPPR